MNRAFAGMLAGEAPPQRDEDHPDEALALACRDSADALLDVFAQAGCWIVRARAVSPPQPVSAQLPVDAYLRDESRRRMR